MSTNVNNCASLGYKTQQRLGDGKIVNPCSCDAPADHVSWIGNQFAAPAGLQRDVARPAR